jgi:hypothetical protein
MMSISPANNRFCNEFITQFRESLPTDEELRFPERFDNIASLMNMLSNEKIIGNQIATDSKRYRFIQREDEDIRLHEIFKRTFQYDHEAVIALCQKQDPAGVYDFSAPKRFLYYSLPKAVIEIISNDYVIMGVSLGLFTYGLVKTIIFYIHQWHKIAVMADLYLSFDFYVFLESISTIMELYYEYMLVTFVTIGLSMVYLETAFSENSAVGRFVQRFNPARFSPYFSMLLPQNSEDFLERVFIDGLEFVVEESEKLQNFLKNKLVSIEKNRLSYAKNRCFTLFMKNFKSQLPQGQA